MNNINYAGEWALDISKMTEAEWDQLVSICDAKGIVMYMRSYDGSWNNLICSDYGPELVRTNAKYDTQVSILEMLNLLETPTKSPSQLKIDELQQVIDIANDQIEALKEL